VSKPAALASCNINRWQKGITNMPEETNGGFMQKLDQWTEHEVLYPLGDAWMAFYEAPGDKPSEEYNQRLREVEAEVKKLIREKVLESYRNGQKAGSEGQNRPRFETRKPFRPTKPNAQAPRK
jgi:hypothetical protein